MKVGDVYVDSDDGERLRITKVNGIICDGIYIHGIRVGVTFSKSDSSQWGKWKLDKEFTVRRILDLHEER